MPVPVLLMMTSMTLHVLSHMMIIMMVVVMMMMTMLTVVIKSDGRSAVGGGAQFGEPHDNGCSHVWSLHGF